MLTRASADTGTSERTDGHVRPSPDAPRSRFVTGVWVSLGAAMSEPALTWCTRALVHLIIGVGLAVLAEAPWIYLITALVVALQAVLALWRQRHPAAPHAVPREDPGAIEPSAGPACEPGTDETDERDAIAARMPPAAVTALGDAVAVLRRRLGADIATGFYACRCGQPDSSTCTCGDIRLTASIIGLDHHEPPALIVGDLLAASPEQLRFVLAHELRHTTRPHRLFRAGRLTLLNYGWLPFGALMPLPPAHLALCAVLVWALLISTAWAEEIICDAAAAHRAGRGSARSWFTAVKAANRRARKDHCIVVPLHPPMVLRRLCIA